LKKISVKELGWQCLVKNGTASKINIGYLLKEGPKEHVIFGVLLEGKMKTRLEHLIKWGLKQFKRPESYKILGKTIEPRYEVSYVNKAIVGDIYGTPEASFRIDQIIHHPTKSEKGEMKFLSNDELPDEIRDIIRLIDEEVWQKMRGDVVHRFEISKTMIPRSLLKCVFLAYRANNALGKTSASSLGKYLKDRGFSVWYFSWRVGWGDSMTEKEEDGIKKSFAGVIIYTSDFSDGKTATEEYRALLAKRRSDSDFKVGLLLVGCPHEKVPPFMRDYFWAAVDGPEDQRFEEEAKKIYRGLLGLPLQSPELSGKVELNSIGESDGRRLAHVHNHKNHIDKGFYHMLVWPHENVLTSDPEIEGDLTFEDCSEIIKDIRESETFFLNGRKRKSDRITRYEAYKTEKKLKVLSKEDSSFVRTSDYHLITTFGDKITREFIRRKH